MKHDRSTLAGRLGVLVGVITLSVRESGFDSSNIQMISSSQAYGCRNEIEPELKMTLLNIFL